MEYSKKYELLYLIIAYYSLFLSLTSKNKKNKIFFFYTNYNINGLSKILRYI